MLDDILVSVETVPARAMRPAPLPTYLEKRFEERLTKEITGLAEKRPEINRKPSKPYIPQLYARILEYI